jgi:hypothetical protein
MRVYARVPENSRCRRHVEVLEGIDQQDRPPVESQFHDDPVEQTGVPVLASITTAWPSSVDVWGTTAWRASR